MNDCLWSPSDDRVKKSQMMKFMTFINTRFNQQIVNYQELHQFSIQHKNDFWVSLFDFFNINFSGDLNPVLREDSFDQYTWFSNVNLNFAENLLSKGRDESVALNFVHESGLTKKLTYKELKDDVLVLKNYLKSFLKEGDVLAAYMPNIPETTISMLATSSLGGVFTSTSCDFGIEGVIDRFGQTNPKVLIAAVGYQYGEKYFDLLPKIREIRKKIPSLQKIILVNFLSREILLDNEIIQSHDFILYEDIKKMTDSYNSELILTFKSLPFHHPLYIMYSSGTTGKPKCIVHSQGGTLLQHLKELGLHCDLDESKSIFFFTTCGWMMWNWLMSSLALGATIVLYEGSPASPSPEYFFHIINREKINIFGTSPKFLKALEDTNARFVEFDSLETILSTGSPLLPEQYDFVYKKIKKDVLLGSISGGTDIVSCFMLASPILPVFKGEIQCLGLGMDVLAIDEKKNALIEVEGELVCAQTFPSRPLCFLNDEQNEKIQSAYFNQNNGYWTHGDFVKMTKNGGVIVYGRSDATLNPGGVRIGTAEIYRQTEQLPFIMDSLCVGRPVDGDVEVVLFVKLKSGETLTVERKKQIKEVIKKNTTPRHVPKEIYQVSDIPYTRSGKKVELAIARILAKKEITNLEAIANPECLNEYYTI
jgi:acetoacetyl-CoA synthetase